MSDALPDELRYYLPGEPGLGLSAPLVPSVFPGEGTVPVTWGSLPGTSTLLVRSYHNFSWVALFNARAQAGNFDGELDAALWTALAQVTSIPAHDLFSTFP